MKKERVGDWAHKANTHITGIRGRVHIWVCVVECMCGEGEGALK